MSQLPEQDTTIARIYRAWEERERGGRPRAHLGASQMGRPCGRERWLAFRWAAAPDYEGRILRLFDRGKREEAAFIRDLRAAGVTVHETDPETGRQFQFAAYGGHLGGSMDAAAVGFPEAPKTWHVVEFKTHSAKSFEALKKHGVEKAHRDHYAQVQLYMGWSGMDRAFYLAVNKDNDELYAERLEFDRIAFDLLLAQAEDVIFGRDPEDPTAQPAVPKRLSESPAHFYCKQFCPLAAVCHGPAFPRANCRTCAHSTPVPDGTWRCERHAKTLGLADQEAGCPDHLFLPPMVALPVREAGAGWVAYDGDHGAVTNAAAGAAVPENLRPAFTSQELARLTFDQVPAAAAAKSTFNGTIQEAIP